MVKLFIFLANVLLPLTSFFLAYRYPQVSYGWLFSAGIFTHVLYRMWETFFTSKEREPQKFEGDWTLAVGTLAYIGFCFLITFEYFLIPHRRFLGTFILGGLFYLIAARLRFWGEATLGSQWAVHVVGDTKTTKSRMLRIGPYRYIRHPIYFGILLEELALPLLANTFLSLLMVFSVNAPLLLTRLFLEEKRSLLKFGESYLSYRRKTGAFFPKLRRADFVKQLFLELI